MPRTRNIFIRGAAFSLFMLFLTAIFWPFSAKADGVVGDGKSGVKISPAYIQDKAEPGQVYDSELEVTNVSQAAQNFYLLKSNITGMDSNGQPVFSTSTDSEGYGMEDWLQLPPGPLAVPAGSTLKIPFTVQVPANAGPGSHFGAIFVTIKTDQTKQNGASVGYEVASLINLQIAGNIMENTQIREFSTDRSVYNDPNIIFSIRAENLGNTLSRPTGFVEISNMFGNKVATISVNETGGGVFPGSIRRFKAVWDASGFTFGRYQAMLSLVYGDSGQKTITSTLSFWVLPIKPIATVLGIIIILLAAILLSVRIYVKRKLRVTAQALGKPLVGNTPIQAVPVAQNLKPSSFSRLALVSTFLLGIVIVLLLVLFLFFS